MDSRPHLGGYPRQGAYKQAGNDRTGHFSSADVYPGAVFFFRQLEADIDGVEFAVVHTIETAQALGFLEIFKGTAVVGAIFRTGFAGGAFAVGFKVEKTELCNDAVERT
jgi:hypothetical protein